MGHEKEPAELKDWSKGRWEVAVFHREEVAASV